MRLSVSLALLVPFAALVTRPGASQAEGAERPNVLFMISDDQAAGTLSCAGHPLLSTPSLDRLAASGVRFANAFTTSSICSASRASFLTGHYARSHGVLHNRDQLRGHVRSFPHLFTRAGWDTAYVGKWHLGGRSVNSLRGFTHTCALPVQGRYRDADFYRDGELIQTEGFVDDVTTDFAIEFLGRPREAPFLLYVGFKSAHRPRDPADRFDELFADATFEPPASVDHLPPFPRRSEWSGMSREAGHRVEDDAPAADWAADYGERPSLITFDEVRLESRRNYLRLIAGVDENVGRLLDALDALELAETTIVVFTSDHGYMHGEHGLGGKAVAYEESIRTPLLIRDPRNTKAGLVVNELAVNIDLAPTLLDLVGLGIPTGTQGRSLRPLLERTDTSWREAFVYEFYRSPMYGGVPTTIALRHERWKLITYPGYPAWTELFDLDADPYEMNDLARSADSADTLVRLTAQLAELEAEAGPRAE
jgi:arylsulfatase A-like enzyme